MAKRPRKPKSRLKWTGERWAVEFTETVFVKVKDGSLYQIEADDATLIFPPAKSNG